MQKITKHLGNIFATTIFTVLISVVSISAATFTVTNTNDSGAGSLRQAVLDARAAASDDIINFDSSFNVPRTITLGGTEILINGNGSLTINGPGMNLLTVSGNDASIVFNVNGINAPTIQTVTFNNLTIERGFGGGGGISVNDGVSGSPDPAFVDLIVNNVFFRNNQGGSFPGGAIGTFRKACKLTVNNSTFTQNHANNGGAIDNGGCSIVNIINSTFYENIDEVVTLHGFPGVHPTYTISGSTFYNNVSQGHMLFIQTGSTNNTITNSTFFNNRTGSGAILLGIGEITMTNVTVARNSTVFDTLPGGITLRNNAQLNIGNSIVSQNTSPSGENNFQTESTLSPPITSQGYNIFGPSDFVMFNGDSTGNQLGVNPLLDSLLRDNGGPTKTLNLRPGSPAIDAGNPTTFPATDQRGISRPQDGDGNGNSRSDIGAFEKRTIDKIPATFDFDGDSKTDISIFRPNVGEWWIRRSSDGIVPAFQFGTSSDKIVPADYTRDGKTDVAFWRESTAQWFILRSEDSNFYAFPFGAAGDIPTPADFDGDGKSDAAVFRPSNSTWYILNSSGGTTITPFGTSGDLPVAADYDGDGKADIGIYRPSNGQWWINRSASGLFVTTFGVSSDKTVPADYTGDGKTDIAFFRPSTGFWYILRSEDAQFYAFPFGANADTPAPGDYDGDGRADAAVFRNSNTTWYLQQSTSGAAIVGFGATGDIPLASAFVR